MPSRTIGNRQLKIENRQMIVGTGVDIAEVPRIAQAIARYGERFLRRIYTQAEMRYCDSKANRVERYAARFAAKEAAMKALGTGWNHGVRWVDCEVTRQPGGRPTMKFHGKLPSSLPGSAPTTSRCPSLTPPSRLSHRSSSKADGALC